MEPTSSDQPRHSGHVAPPFAQEIFGPILTVYVYPEKDYKEVLELIDNTSPYALTGSVFAQDQ